MKTISVRDCMSKLVLTIGSQASLKEAHDLMREKRVRRLPVVDQDALVGIVTLLDVSEARPPGADTLRPTALVVSISLMKVADVMTRNPITVTPDATILDIARLMARHKIGGIPVVEQGQVVGIVSESDAFRTLVQAIDEEERHKAVSTTQGTKTV